MSFDSYDATGPEVSARNGLFLVRRAPGADLCGLVDGIVGYAENGVAMRNAVEMAPLVVPLIISFADPFEIALGRAPKPDETYGSFTSGLFPGHVVINSTGRSQCVQIDFTPLGAYRFFGFPMRDIASRMVTLADLGDPDIDRLREQLGEARDWDHRLRLAEDFARTRLAVAPPASSAIARAHEAILRGQGLARIGDIARALDWSRKHLNQRFREEVGIGPKAFSRMVRFNRALALARAGTGEGWAGIAFDCGYADQAHLVREFREFAGATPTALPAGLA